MILELTREQLAFKESAEKFAREIVAQRAAGIDKTGEFPADVIHAAAAAGLCGITIPKNWGGAGRDYISYALAIEAIAKASATVAVSLVVTNSLVAELIAHAGRGQGVTAFLVAMDTPGITRTARADSLGVRGLGCMDLELDIVVGEDQVLGRVDQGFPLAMWALQGGRVAIAAQALGIGEAALAEAIGHAKHRVQFGKPIASYQAIQWMLADIATELEAARLLTLKAAAAKDRQEKIALEASMAKLAASEAAHKAADKAMQILASAGYRRGSVVERLFRDVRATEIYQGTSEAQQTIIAAKVLGTA